MMSLLRGIKNLFFPHVNHERYHGINPDMTIVSVKNSPMKAWEEALPDEYRFHAFKDLPQVWRYRYVVSLAKLYDMAMPKKIELMGKMLNLIAMTLFEHRVNDFGCSMSLENNATQDNTALEQFHLRVSVLMGQRADIENVNNSIHTRSEKKRHLVSESEIAVMRLYAQCVSAMRASDEKEAAKLCAMVLTIFECASRDNYHVFDAVLKNPYNAQHQSKHEYYALFKREVQKSEH